MDVSCVVIAPYQGTYHNQIIRVRPLETGNAYTLRQSILCFKFHVQALSEIGLYADCLQNEDAHSNQAVFGWVGLVFNGVENAKDHKIM